MLNMHNLSKVYQTEDVETAALNSVNIRVGGGICRHYGAIRVW